MLGMTRPQFPEAEANTKLVNWTSEKDVHLMVHLMQASSLQKTTSDTHASSIHTNIQQFQTEALC